MSMLFSDLSNFFYLTIIILGHSLKFCPLRSNQNHIRITERDKTIFRNFFIPVEQDRSKILLMYNQILWEPG
jgi:hypothetical protein